MSELGKALRVMATDNVYAPAFADGEHHFIVNTEWKLNPATLLREYRVKATFQAQFFHINNASPPPAFMVRNAEQKVLDIVFGEFVEPLLRAERALKFAPISRSVEEALRIIREVREGFFTTETLQD